MIESVALIVAISVSSAVLARDSEATRLLKARSAEFERAVIEVTDDVYVAAGYAVSPVSGSVQGR